MNLSPASSLIFGSTLSSGSSSSGTSSSGSSSSGSASSVSSISSVSSLASASSVSSSDVDDDSSMPSSSTMSSDSDDTMDRFMASQLSIDWTGDSNLDRDIPPQRKRSSNRFAFQFGDYLDCNYYRKFLCQDIRDVTYEKSQDRKSVFRSHFRVPLKTIDDLTEMHIRNGWVRYTGRVRTNFQLSIRTQLFIMCALEHMGNRKPHCQFETETNMSASSHLHFFNNFIVNMYSVRSEYVFYPRTMEELQVTVHDYESQHLPGAGGSIDVVHVKWSNCPAGDYNKCKVKNLFHPLPSNV
eukprot:g1628.t1 g1628   contig10:2468934-2469824(-)